MTDSTPAETTTAAAYRVLARKYRPSGFDGLIGQDALVRTLTNAVRSGRIAQAYMLTGVRGVGKTTTARIIARALNCVDGPTVTPCGVCEHCVAIEEDRHVDVLEMDAASRTGVGDIREILDGVRYRPTMARFKIYIIDEVHMLSANAFNALLKTLEEPPEHVKFVFATTEIRKVPVTVLSRCQRFDLRRVEAGTLARHFAHIAETEGVRVEPGALRLIARAADGSVRDGLSLLDQAIAHGADGSVGEEQVKDMLGLADRERLLDLFELLMKGDTAAALALLDALYAAGADPQTVLQDLLELTHALTRMKVAPDHSEDLMAPESERVRGRALAGVLSMPVLTRAWQILLKGAGEARTAPSVRQAAEMALVRLAFAADLPSPAEVIAALEKDGGRTAAGMPSPSPQTAASPSFPQGPGRTPVPNADAPPRDASGGPATALARPHAETRPWEGAEPAPDPAPDEDGPRSLEDLVAWLEARREALLAAHLTNNVHLVHFEPGRIEFRPAEDAPPGPAQQLSRRLGELTRRRWFVSISNRPGAPTLRESRMDGVRRHPLVQAVLRDFDAEIGVIRRLDATTTALDDPEPAAAEDASAPDITMVDEDD